MLLVRAAVQMSAQRHGVWFILLRGQSTWVIRNFCWGSHHHQGCAETEESRESSHVFPVTWLVPQAEAQLLSIYKEEVRVHSEMIWPTPLTSWKKTPQARKRQGPKWNSPPSLFISRNSWHHSLPLKISMHLICSKNVMISKNLFVVQYGSHWQT